MTYFLKEYNILKAFFLSELVCESHNDESFTKKVDKYFSN